MKHIGHIGLMRLIGIFMVLFAIGFNLWTYKLEPTAKLDPNDNTFQFALVERTNQIWDFAQQKCSGVSKSFCVLSYLTDHWVPNWAQGYNLPYYYTHIPQITIVASYKFVTSLLGYFVTWFDFSKTISLFSYYHVIIYLLLSLFPLSLFLALRIINLSWITAGIGALIASHLSTDGLYGLDPASFLFRGYGLSSQLFAMIWLPLTLAYASKYFQDVRIKNKDLGINTLHSYLLNLKSAVPSIIFLAAVTAGHLGIGIISFISIGIMALSEPLHLFLQSFESESTNKRIMQDILTLLFDNGKKLLLLYGGVLLLLGYWIIPILKDGNYHNISVWDPIWKFDSYGYREVLKNLFNGDLFDFGRFPILTILVTIGLFSSVLPRFKNEDIRIKNNENSTTLNPNSYFLFPFGVLFLFWLLFYFGRTTWGGLVNLIPSMEEFHLSRFIVGLHITGLFLIPIGIDWLVTKFSKRIIIRLFAYLFICIFVYFAVYPQTLRYSSHNNTLIKQANDNFNKVESDVARLLSAISHQLSVNPGRVYFGRGGTWGKSFQIAETPMFIYMSTFGIPTLTWLPETWSPNSDTEQYFSEDVAAHYILYNIKYVVTPIDLPKDKIQAFWKPLTTGITWRLYEVTDPVGYISTGFRPAIVSSSKRNFTNVVRLWIQSDSHTKNLYPELTFDKNYPKTFGLPNFRMIDEVTYQIPDGSLHNLFAEVPRYEAPISNPESQNPNLGIISQSNDNDMIFKATVTVSEKCTECLVILRQTYHPSWRATVDGEPVKPFTVFPFYTAIKLDTPGRHEIIFSYQPSLFKKFFLIIALVTLSALIWLVRSNRGQS